MSSIEWTDETWNPIVGCSLESPGCTNCYAMRMAARLSEISYGKSKGAHGLDHYRGLTKSVNGSKVWTGLVKPAPEKLFLKPLGWKKPKTIFVNSMGDLFHESIPDHEIDKVFAIMALCPQHTFQILTKRAERMREYFEGATLPTDCEPWGSRRNAIHQLLCDDMDAISLDENHLVRVRAAVGNTNWPLSNVWLGVSAEDQKRADERIPRLLATPAAKRFISAEPLIGPVDLSRFLGDIELDNNGPILRGLDWIIAGGESGPGARPPHPDWFRKIRDDCQSAEVPFFFKQWGSWAPYTVQPGGDLGGLVRSGKVRIVHPSGRNNVEISEATGGRSTEKGARYMVNLGKGETGATLDGREHREFPVFCESSSRDPGCAGRTAGGKSALPRGLTARSEAPKLAGDAK